MKMNIRDVFKLALWNLFVLNCLFQPIYAQEKGLTIHGEIKGVVNGTRFFLIRNNGRIPDTLQISKATGNVFNFSAVVPLGAEYHFIKMEGIRTYISLFLDNGKVEIKGNAEDWPNVKVTGSTSHNNYLEMLNKIEAFKPKINYLDSLTAVAVRNLDTARVTELRKQSEEAKTHYNTNWKNVIDEYPDSYYTPLLIAKLPVLSGIQKMAGYEKLTNRVKNSRHGLELKRILDVDAASSKIAVGSTIPHITSLDRNGKFFSINEFVSKNNLTLLDFWASWCVPCLEETPVLRKTYEDFKSSGFNILGISADDSKRNWIAAISKGQMDWEHVCELKGRSESAYEIFQISGIPSWILVDKDGVIIAMDLPGSKIPSAVYELRGEKLYKKVATFFGDNKSDQK